VILDFAMVYERSVLCMDFTQHRRPKECRYHVDICFGHKKIYRYKHWSSNIYI